MTFKDVVVKNFKYNIRKYKSFLMSSIFSVMIMFIYSTIYFNNDVIKMINNSFLYYTFRGSFYALILFCLFFICYTHMAFIRGRGREFGLLMTLGLTEKNINRLVYVENNILGVISMILGIIFGTAFSKLLFILICDALDFKDVVFYLHYKNYVAVFIFYTAAFIIMTLNCRNFIKNIEITKIMKADRSIRKNNIENLYLGITGLILVVVSILLSYLTVKGIIFRTQMYMLGVYISICGLGLYLFISQFGAISLSFMRKHENIYYNKVLEISEVAYKYTDYKTVVYLLCLFSAAFIFFIGNTYGFYASVKADTNKANPFDIMYVQSKYTNKLSEETIRDILSKSDTPLSEKYCIECLNLNYKGEIFRGFYGRGKNFIISDESLKELTNKDISIDRGECIYLFRKSEKINKSIENKGTELQLYKDKESKDIIGKFKLKDTLELNLFNIRMGKDYDTCNVIVLSRDDYNVIAKMNGVEKYYLNLFNFKDSQKTEKVFRKFFNEVNKQNDNLSFDDSDIFKMYIQLRETILSRKVPVLSKYMAYKAYMWDARGTLFIFSFLGILFFLGAGAILYFKVYSNMEYMKSLYTKLFKIGITSDETKKYIASQLKIIFFLPVTLGSVVGLSFIISMMFETNDFIKFFINVCIIIFIYIVFQIVFYSITLNKCLKEVCQ